MARGLTSCQVSKSMLWHELTPQISKHSESETLSTKLPTPSFREDKVRDLGSLYRTGNPRYQEE